MKVCSEHGCPKLQAESRCLMHRREREQDRGYSTARGYGVKHQQIRAAWAPIVAAGTVTCWRCEHLIAPDQSFDLGHDDHDRGTYRGPEHQACNRATAGR